MAVYKDSSRLEWLVAAWTEQRLRVSKILGRITDLGALQAMTPAVLHKFLRLMDQVGEAKQKEIKIISNIDAIEEQHRFRRTHNQLKHAGPKAQSPNSELDLNEECEQPKRQLMWLLAFWYLFMRKKNNQNKQDLTPD